MPCPCRTHAMLWPCLSSQGHDIAGIAGNILLTVHTSCHPTLQHRNSYNRTDNHRQWNAFGSPDDGHKDARNMLRYYWLTINHLLLHLVGLILIYDKIYLYRARSGFEPESPVHIRTWTWNAGNKYEIKDRQEWEEERGSNKWCCCVMPGFRRGVYENCARLCYYAVNSGNFLPTFRGNISVPSSRVQWRWGRYVVPKRR